MDDNLQNTYQHDDQSYTVHLLVFHMYLLKLPYRVHYVILVMLHVLVILYISNSQLILLL